MKYKNFYIFPRKITVYQCTPVIHSEISFLRMKLIKTILAAFLRAIEIYFLLSIINSTLFENEFDETNDTGNLLLPVYQTVFLITGVEK